MFDLYVHQLIERNEYPILRQHLLFEVLYLLHHRDHLVAGGVRDHAFFGHDSVNQLRWGDIEGRVPGLGALGRGARAAVIQDLRLGAGLDGEAEETVPIYEFKCDHCGRLTSVFLKSISAEPARGRQGVWLSSSRP